MLKSSGTQPHRVLIIGAGITGSLIANLIHRNPELNTLLAVSILDKGSEVGGRFYTHYLENKTKPVDLGAQYLSQTNGNIISRPYFEELVANGLLRQLDVSKINGFHQDSSKIHYACVNGSASIVKYFLNNSNAKTTIKTQVEEVNIKEETISVHSRTKENVENREDFDTVISTIPVPQLLNLNGIHDILPCNIKLMLQEVKYSSRYALGLYFEPEIVYPDLQPLNYIQDKSSPIRYWAVDGYKRTGTLPNSSTVAVHTAVYAQNEFINNSETIPLSEFQEKILSEAMKCISPTQQVDSKIFCKLHRWRYSQVVKTFGNGSDGFVVINQKPIFIASGDGFVGSGFENCINAATKTVNYLQTVYKK